MTQTQTDEFPLAKLNKLLRDTWEEHRQKTPKSVVRIASFNLLIVSTGETDPELAAIVEGLEVSHPSRLIWTKIKPEKTWAESTASVNLVTKCDGQQVCSEQVILRCGNDRARIPSLVLPLIHPGLPTHLLWWKAGSLQCSLFRRLEDRCRLVLWEPEGHPTTSDLEYLERTWQDRYQREHSVYPMAWFRIRGMRERIASAYDLGDVKLRLSDPGSEMSLPHRLLQSWLTSRLSTGDFHPVDLAWSPGAEKCLLEGPREESLTLLDHTRATRYALDTVERDPIFSEALRALLVPA